MRWTDHCGLRSLHISPDKIRIHQDMSTHCNCIMWSFVWTNGNKNKDSCCG